MSWMLAISAAVAVTALAVAPDALQTNSVGLDRFERRIRIKSLLRQLDSLPDSDLREVLIQLRALRRSRATPPPRDLSKVPIGDLTEEELLQVSNLVPMVKKRPKKPHVPLDIPHDLARVPIALFIEAFRIVHPTNDLKDFEVKLKTKEDPGIFGEEDRQGDTDQKDDAVEKTTKPAPIAAKNAKNHTQSKIVTSTPDTPTMSLDSDEFDFDANP